MGLRSSVRRRLGSELRNSGALRELRVTVDRRLADDHRRLDRYTERTDRLQARIEAQAAKLDKLGKTLTALQDKVRPLEQTVHFHDVDHGHFSTQLAAMEERVGRLEQLATDTPLAADADDAAQARSLLDEVRREHEQIRVRMQAITWYEERLRRVESSLTSIYTGDPRHPI